MIDFWRRLRPEKPEPSDGQVLRLDHPVVVFQSDDWGRVGVRDRDGWDALKAAGLNLGEEPYDYYSLETADDLRALAGVLRKHRDCNGRNPVIGMNFVLANVDFEKATSKSEGEIPLVPVTSGLPGNWQRPQLFEVLHQCVAERLFSPALHGLTHFCPPVVSAERSALNPRGDLLRALWANQTPYIFWRMPWVGYEYWNPQAAPDQRFLAASEQKSAIEQAARIFSDFFGKTAVSACAPGYRANTDTNAAWLDCGVRVRQNGPSETASAPRLEANGLLHTFRTIEMEPATSTCDLASILRSAEKCFKKGLPAIVSIHSINFHSTLRDFRSPTLELLDHFLTALETRWPELTYADDEDLLRLAMAGATQIEQVKNQSIVHVDEGLA